MEGETYREDVSTKCGLPLLSWFCFLCFLLFCWSENKKVLEKGPHVPPPPQKKRKKREEKKTHTSKENLVNHHN